jgi:hypothetical protein
MDLEELTSSALNNASDFLVRHSMLWFIFIVVRIFREPAKKRRREDSTKKRCSMNLHENVC